MDQSYFEELIVLTIVGILLLIAKLTACCFSLGLHQSHNAINLRQDSLSIAKLNHLQLERVSEEEREELVTCNANALEARRETLQLNPESPLSWKSLRKPWFVYEFILLTLLNYPQN